MRHGALCCVPEHKLSTNYVFSEVSSTFDIVLHSNYNVSASWKSPVTLQAVFAANEQIAREVVKILGISES